MTVFGDVSEQREIGERTNDRDGIVGLQRPQQPVQFVGGGSGRAAADRHGQLPDGFDEIEDLGAFLLAHRIAQNLAEQPDILNQRIVLVLMLHCSRQMPVQDQIVQCTSLA